jgi:hypothetical protein
MRQWIVTAGGDSVTVDKAFGAFVLEKAGLFCLTEDDKLFVAKKIAVGDTDILEDLFSRLLLVGIAVDVPLLVPANAPPNSPRRGWKLVGSMSTPVPLARGDRLEDHDSPAIILELSDFGELFVAFHRESTPFWERIKKWLASAPVEVGISPKAVVAFKEWTSQRAWCQTVESTLWKEVQYSKDPKKGARCNRCGASIGWEELLTTRACSACGMELA